MATNGCDVNHLDSDSLLPPRKRLLAGFKKQNSIIIGNGYHLPSSSSSTLNSNSNGSCSSSSSASADVQTHLDNLLLTSQLNDHTQSPEELAQASKVTAALALKVAKAARATADEKALIASKAVAAAKTALELFASFPAESKTERKNKQKKHVPVQLLYSKGAACAVDEDLARRLNRAINNSPRVLRNKKQKTHENIPVTSSITMYDGHDVAGVVDSDSSNDDELDGTRVNGRLLLCGNDNAVKEKSGEESSLVGKRRGRVLKLKKLPLLEKNVGVSKSLAQPEGSNGGVAQVRS